MEVKGKEQPRLFTKPLRELTERTTLGYALIRFAEEILHFDLYPWQKWLALHALEIVGDIDAEWHFRFRSVLVLIGRQNGKTTFLEVLSLFFMFVLRSETVLGTAQTVSIAEKSMKETLEIAQTNEVLAPQIAKICNVNGNKYFSSPWGTYLCKPSNDKAARGISVDLAIMDEIREHTDDNAWGAVSKTTNARPNSQIWAITSAGESKSIMLNRLRANAHFALGDPDGICQSLADSLPDEQQQFIDESFAIFEWSAIPGCAMDDKEQWAQANPSLGHGLLTERAIASNLATDSEKVFRTEVLCQWVETRNPNPFGEAAWQAACDENSTILGNDVYFGIDISKNRDYTAIGVCGVRPDGTLHTEVVAYQLGVGWALEWLRERIPEYGTIKLGLQERGAVVSSYIDEFSKIDGVEVVPISGRNLTDGTAGWFDGIMAHTRDNGCTRISHIGQEVLNSAVDGAAQKMFADGAFLFDRNRSETDISPINACIMSFSAKMLDNSEKCGTLQASAVEANGGQVFCL